MEYTYIAVIMLAILAHIGFAGFSTAQVFSVVFSSTERMKLLFLIWLVPFLGAYKANLCMNPKWKASTIVIYREP
jgi:hypothetical protein